MHIDPHRESVLPQITSAAASMPFGLPTTESPVQLAMKTLAASAATSSNLLNPALVIRFSKS